MPSIYQGYPSPPSSDIYLFKLLGWPPSGDSYKKNGCKYVFYHVKFDPLSRNILGKVPLFAIKLRTFK